MHYTTILKIKQQKGHRSDLLESPTEVKTQHCPDKPCGFRTQPAHSKV